MELVQRARSFVERTAPPAPVLCMAALCLAAAASALMGGLFPANRAAPAQLLTIAGVYGLCAATALWYVGDRAPSWVLQATVASATVMTSVIILRTPTGEGIIATACAYIWIGLYVGFFFSRRAARAQIALIAVCFGAALLLSDQWVPVQAWVFIMASLLVAGETLGRQSDRLRHEAHTDSLTGALNRKGLTLASDRAFSLADRTEIPLTVALIDLDDFKQINDRDGHPAGDQLLMHTARVWRGELEASDIFARFGGDEFLAVLVVVSSEESGRMLTRLRILTPTPWSAGVITRHSGEDLSSCLSRADRALYEAKRARAGNGLPVDREQDDRARHPDHRRADHPVVAG
jgi:diguanylate cyclase (GGDEF)-like protein